MLQKINIVWFKRDLRIQDHAPLKYAFESNLPCLLIYIYEPTLLQSPKYDLRHWRFVYESLLEMKIYLKQTNNQLNIFYDEAVNVFLEIQKQYEVINLLSYEETGIAATYARDIEVAKLAKASHINWLEFQNNGVIRRLSDREEWAKKWHQFMLLPLDHVVLKNGHSLKIEDHEVMLSQFSFAAQTEHLMQIGGSIKAHELLDSFIIKRHKKYMQHISKPSESRESCSRLSPYLAWGNISIRQVIHFIKAHHHQSSNKRNLNQFQSRLMWHCHFIQKFESECRIEYENFNRAFDAIRTAKNEAFIQAWKDGTTGFPLVDACMRCLIATGYINFRMRAMLVSFLTHHLWQDWRHGAEWLAQNFLDFEPGIHYPQLQMQAGCTGINTVRIYNPIKQSKEHDPDAIFIKKWIPELENIPAPLAHEPWKITAMEQFLYDFQPGITYPIPIIDIEIAGAMARKEIWTIMNSVFAKEEGKKMLRRHVKSKIRKEAEAQGRLIS